MRKIGIVRNYKQTGEYSRLVFLFYELLRKNQRRREYYAQRTERCCYTLGYGLYTSCNEYGNYGYIVYTTCRRTNSNVY